MHVDHVSKGMELVSDLTKVVKDPEEIRTKRGALNNWADGATRAIMRTISEKQNEIKDGLGSRIENIAEQTQMLQKVGVPKPDPAFVAAMKTGAATVTEHVEKNMPQGMAVYTRMLCSNDYGASPGSVCTPTRLCSAIHIPFARLVVISLVLVCLTRSDTYVNYCYFYSIIASSYVIAC